MIIDNILFLYFLQRNLFRLIHQTKNTQKVQTSAETAVTLPLMI